MQSREIPVVVICGDVGAPPVPLRPGELAARLRRELPGVTALLLGEICETPQALSEGLAAARPNRVVVACRADPQRDGELRTRLRSAGAAPAGTEIVDLKTADGCSATVALEQSVALVSAAVVRVAVADVTAPVRERTSLLVGGVTRRSLLRGVNTARHFVAVWRPERCTTAAACTACVLACPHGALRQQGRRVVVDGDRCTGCGACVACCRNAALVLPGAELEGLGAAAAVLGAVARRDGSVVGVSIVCRHAEPVPLIGEAWLVLRVPSVEMVTAGWILQLVSAGVNVRVLGCKDQDCETRASDLEGFVRALMQALGFSEGEAAFIKAPAGRESGSDRLGTLGRWDRTARARSDHAGAVGSGSTRAGAGTVAGGGRRMLARGGRRRPGRLLALRGLRGRLPDGRLCGGAERRRSSPFERRLESLQRLRGMCHFVP